jgi:hypothetical protein
MTKIRVLDCTMRDGGCVINFNSPALYGRSARDWKNQVWMSSELGFFDSAKGSPSAGPSLSAMLRSANVY